MKLNLEPKTKAQQLVKEYLENNAPSALAEKINCGVAIEKDGEMIPKIKISDNVEKVTNPGLKKVYRIYEKDTGMAQADLMALEHEVLDDQKDLTIYHPMSRWKYKVIEGGTYELRELLVPIFLRGKIVYQCPSLDGIREYSKRELDTIWEEIKRFAYPQEYYVDLTKDDRWLIVACDGLFDTVPNDCVGLIAKNALNASTLARDLRNIAYNRLCPDNISVVAVDLRGME